MTLGIPQMIFLALVFLSLGISCAKHGQPHTGKYSIWTSLAAEGLMFGLLYWGGFFK